MFTLDENLGFEREKDGSVVIKLGLAYVKIPPSEWASVLTEVSHRPANAEAYQEAFEFHMGHKTTDKKPELEIPKPDLPTIEEETFEK